MTVQRVDALVEEVAVGLPKQTKVGREVVGSVEAANLRTTPSLARGVRSEPS